MRELNNGISIIIPAYKAEKFIKRSLDSIYRSSWIRENNNFDVMVGVDNCESTQTRLAEIRDGYRNLNIYRFTKHEGPYIIRNTLAYIPNYNYLLFFDADDIMFSSLIQLHMQNRDGADIVRHHHKNVFIEKHSISPLYLTIGSFGIWAEKFQECGGFHAWPCEADSEFASRTRRFGMSVCDLGVMGLVRCVYGKNLTQIMGKDHPIRKELQALRGETKTKYITPVFGAYEVVLW
jgi:glycosyltransferase involved in cell wall biosynthesis